MTAALVLLDLLLITLTAMRVTRLIVTDDVGLWFVKVPVMRWAIKADARKGLTQDQRHRMTETKEWEPGWRAKLSTGLSCPFCIGFWIGGLVLLSYGVFTGWDLGANTTGAEVWRWLAAPWALNEVAAHVGARLGDVSDD